MPIIQVAPRFWVVLDGCVNSMLSRAAAFLCAAGALHAAERVDFNREVRPILAQNCFKCHGVDDQTRKGGLRLDVRDGALAAGKSGQAAIVPSKPERSALVQRIRTADADDLMPPPASKLKLTDAQKDVLERWVREGAEYKLHWSFAAPRQAPLPRVHEKAWSAHPIDRFVLARLERERLRHAPPASRYALVRRLYLDLIGLPPTPAEADAFVQDRTRGAYEKLVDQLLASPRYGERWARRWLDLARYADTNGYEKDRPRQIWAYRDWVIQALNQDMPFDQFTVRQLAGDLLPQATEADRIATGFHRNTMLNEEGGIDPIEFRFYNMVDRVNTTGTAWLGLTMGCAQCHSHKYDPIQQKEYYQFMALLNNADEPEIEVSDAQVSEKRAALEKKISALRAALPDRFSVETMAWQTPAGALTTSTEAKGEVQSDGSWKITGPSPERDTYQLTFTAPAAGWDRLRLEAIGDGNQGPGRTAHGNFVLTEIKVVAVPIDGSAEPRTITWAGAEADVEQSGFAVKDAFDGKNETGWAVHTPGREQGMGSHAATFRFGSALPWTGPTRWTVTLDHQYGGHHTLGHFRVSLGRPVEDGRALEVRQREARDRAFAEWLRGEETRAVRWTEVRPRLVHSEQTRLQVLADGSVYADGDVTKRDLYEVTLGDLPEGVTALRLEAMPDDRLPKHGPGRVYFEGPPGDFFLSEITAQAEGKDLKFNSATQSFADGNSKATSAIDGDPQSGWSVNGAQGRANVAIFRAAAPWTAKEVRLSLLFERYYPAPLGRFKVAITTDPKAADVAAWMPAVAQALATPAAQRTREQEAALFEQFLEVAPELAAARKEIDELRRSMPAFPTTLVLAERPGDHPRVTKRYHRGEFLSPKEEVSAGLPASMPPLPAGAAANRLGLARWLVSTENPLTARVTVNRHWQAFFGRGLVRTLDDFGLQGEMPTHPELLDWLAVEFMKQGWSIKKLHRLIVTSATYQQASIVTREVIERDPDNLLLAHGPRHRLEAELVRDTLLQAGGLLSAKMGGPSVYPPQLASITTEGTYGPLTWKVSEGEDRYRRSVYTFAKRTAPFAMFNTFDGPTGEACVARREVSNTPLQALTILNDEMFQEVAQALGRQLAARPGAAAERLRELFRRFVTRPPTDSELQALLRFAEKQRGRLQAQELNAEALAGRGEGDPLERATWTAVARVVMNLDETVTNH